MAESTFQHLCLVPARVVLDTPKLIPNFGGVYYVFLSGGIELLHASSYFKHYSREPMEHQDKMHLYTGSSQRLRSRINCHLFGDSDQSGFRKTLAALQFACRAISKTETMHCQVKDRGDLNLWLAHNAHFAFVPCTDFREQEMRALARLSSPLNLKCSRTPKYADQLLRWREEFYPRGVF